MNREEVKKWAELFQAAADGKVIECNSAMVGWREACSINTADCKPESYRIKPEPREWFIKADSADHIEFTKAFTHPFNGLKFIRVREVIE